jgi:transcriptional regulator with XRE-family HTH domain
MNDEIISFGKILRELRIKSDYGLREFAKMVDIQPSYLSGIETGKHPPPKPEVIKRMADILGGREKELFAAAEKVDPDISAYMARQPEAADFLRMARDQDFDDQDWRKITDFIKWAKMGKDRTNE